MELKEPMDVVYVHKRKNSDEIIWSIKSVQKNLKHRNIYVIGDDPGLGGITVINSKLSQWSPFSKYHDQINKYLVACQLEELSDNFIAMNDDFFVMGDWEPINYNRGQLGYQAATRLRRDPYFLSLICTEDCLKAWGIATLSYELHTPFVYNKRKLSDLILTIGVDRRPPLQVRSLYGNTYNVKTEYKEDVKNIADFRTSTLLSTTEHQFTNGEIGEYIRSKL